VAVSDPEIKEAELVRHFKAGDTRAFEPIMRRYNRRLFRIARAVMRNDAEAEDVVQETFLAMFARIGQYSGEHPFGAWLTRITLNQAASRLRRGRRVQRLMLGQAGQDWKAGGEPGTSPEEMVAERQLRTALEKAIDGLEPAHRTVLVMRDVEDMSSAAVAACLGISEGAARVRLHRARERLRKSIESTSTGLAKSFGFDGARCDRIVSRVLARAARVGLPHARLQ
jgi:RNA polymerase sigma-70 factor (ECF subfamily)